MSRILLENITKIYESGITAVSDFSLDIQDSCFMVIVGQSGCGKTTTLRLIAGLEQPDSGNIYIDDTLANDVSGKDRDVAMVFQNYTLYPHMTVFQNMAFAMKMRKTPRKQIKKVIKETAALLGIEEFLRRKPCSLSGGQRQRVALGKAIVRKPNAFLFDEPLSNLDAKMRLTMRAEIKALHQKLKTTTIYVTHDQVEAMTLGEQICVMYDGKIQQIGKPMEIYDKPANRYVAGFFGTPPMNFFSGNVGTDQEKINFVRDDNIISLPDSLKKYLSNYNGKEMILGIRPEDISLKPYENGGNNAINAVIRSIEHVGSRTDIYLQIPNVDRFILSTSPYADYEINQAIKIYINSNKIHLFELGQTGRNIIFSGN
ncbi:MAG: sn-glycerol-3-phosphate ABC transporter ATP-binding protein UgpC [Sedimentisphaerales bacterium]|nr:sn-glycerol-3-phosphate ABC transporter ATP-binding protein UgpC [Sedimentisphaerales bacterium]